MLLKVLSLKVKNGTEYLNFRRSFIISSQTLHICHSTQMQFVSNEIRKELRY